MQFRQCRRKPDVEKHDPTAFGEVLTIDHIVTIDPEAESIDGCAYAIVIKDLATGWI